MSKQIEKLQLLSQTGGNWYSMAKLVTETIAANSWKPGQAALIDWMSRASEVTGLSLNTIVRTLPVYEFINKFAPAEAIKIEENAENYPFSSIEILMRIHAIAPSQSPSLLGLISNKEISMRDLRAKLKTIQAEQPQGNSIRRSTSLRNYKEFEKLALFEIHNSLSEFELPEHYEFAALTSRGKNKAHHVNISPPDALAFDREFIDITSTAFNIFYAGQEKMDLSVNKIRLITQCCYMSSFFSKLYLVLPASADQTIAEDIADTFARTQRYNIGVALLKPFKDRSTDKFTFLSRPLDNEAPVPDCRTIVDWNSILS